MGAYNTSVNYKEQADLLDGCKKKEPKSQRKFYEMFAPVMYGICLRYADHTDEANDWLQDGFIKAFAKLENFRNEGSLEGWLKRLFVNYALEQIRHKKTIFHADSLELADQVSYDYPYEAQMDQQQILKLINNLPIGCRTVFNLFIIEGYSHSEIAEQLNITEGTSKSQLARARNLLQQKITQLKTIAGHE